MDRIRQPRPVRLAVLAAAILALHGGDAEAQSAREIRGVVLDDATGQPLPATLVVLIDPRGFELGRRETNPLGAFSFAAPDGSWSVMADRVGYGTLVSDLLHRLEAVVELELRLIPDPVRIDPISVRVRGRRLALDRAGFYERAEMGIGRFITGEEIEKLGPTRVTDALRTEPGVRIMFDPGGAGGTGAEVVFRGAVRDFSGRPCAPTLVLDGTTVRRGGPLPPSDSMLGGARPLRLDEIIHPAEIEGMELYPSGAGVPARFAGMDARCGVILIWRKRTESVP